MPINYKDYPDNWKKEIRPRILERAKNKCELCFAPNSEEVLRDKKTGEWQFDIGNPMLDYSWYRTVKIVLTIHHIDGDRTNNNDLNLIALCQRCHLKLDMGKHVKNRKRNKEKLCKS
jgi:hypothetical protein